MKKIKEIITILLFLNSALFSQSSKSTFETGIKALRAQFIPFEYSRDKTDAIPLWGYKVNDLRSNTKTINPFFFIYKNPENKFGIEFEYFKFQLDRANYDIDNVYRINNTTQYNRYKEYLRNNERSDYKLNFFFIFHQRIKNTSLLVVVSEKLIELEIVQKTTLLLKKK